MRVHKGKCESLNLNRCVRAILPINVPSFHRAASRLSRCCSEPREFLRELSRERRGIIPRAGKHVPKRGQESTRYVTFNIHGAEL
jgi:hypothetical protein